MCSQKCKHVLATDCRSVYDHSARDRGLPKDRVVATELAYVKQVVSEPNQYLRWVPGPEMISDSLIKYQITPESMLRPLLKGRWAGSHR